MRDTIHRVMDKVYDHKTVEEGIYKKWESGGYFKPEVNPDGEPFSIILPPPNANAPLHFGHAMYVIEDILVRFHRMKGFSALWLPGADHAGFETQFVYEKHLSLQGESRFDYSREELFQNIWDFVQNNRGGMENQLRKLGFSLDWSRLKFTMDEDIVKVVYKTFKKLFDDGLVYRDKRLVNYCTFDGTSFSDLEVVSEEVAGEIYDISYPLKNGGEIVVSTTRPETLFGDMAVMVNPDDVRYQNLIGETALIPLIDREIPIIADPYVEKDFGTGAVKVTPFHDFNDWEVGKRHNLGGIQIIGFNGKMQNTMIVDDLYGKQARRKTLELLREKGLLQESRTHTMNKRSCYKCKNILEPLPLEQWFVKMKPLAKRAIESVKNDEIEIHPKSFEKIYFQFLENIRDWNISRQVVWGIRIPAWKNTKTHEWIVTDGKRPTGEDWEQDSDTFDTWFSSSQWPFATLASAHDNDFKKFYPTTVMETGYDILRWWVARMVMMGLYATDKVPFQHIVLHGLVNDPLGKKMSKSKGNVINPLELADQYGADAVRFALVYGTALGNDQALSYPKLEAARRFTNKLWNMGRFILDFKPEDAQSEIGSHHEDAAIIEKLHALVFDINRAYKNYRFNDISEKLYEFTWHEFADKYIESTKGRRVEAQPCLEYVYKTILKLLHPIMPFVTEEIYGKFENEPLIIASWPSE